MGYITDKIEAFLGLSAGEKWKWQDHIHPASFRGVPFGVIDGDGEFGRRVAVHEYPFKDTVYVEDLGRSTRKFTVRGFLIQESLVYDAGDVFSQRNNLIAAVEEKGSALLVHPTFGELTVYIPEGGLKINESAQSERVFEFSLSCIEGGELEFSIVQGDVISSKDNWLKVLATAATKYIGLIKKEVRSLTNFILTVKGVLTGFGDQVKSAISTVTNLGRVLNSIFGNTKYSRFNTGFIGGHASGVTGKTNKVDAADDKKLIEQKIGESATDRDKTLDATDELTNIEEIEDVPENVINVIENIVDSTGDAKEKVNTFENISKNINLSSKNTVVNATNLMLYYMSVSSMAYMALQYTPSNLDEAQDILNRVCEALDKALLLCGDNREDELYMALLNQRNDFIKTYTSRFASLVGMMFVSVPATFPALMLANRLYQDADRSDEIVQAAKPRHPAFMPVEFRAKKS